MIVSSFSDPIALICPSMVGETLLQSIVKAFTHSNKCVVMRHSLLCSTGTPIYLHPAALCQVSSASSAAGHSLARQRRLHLLPPRGVGLPRTCLASVPPDYLTTA